MNGHRTMLVGTGVLGIVLLGSVWAIRFDAVPGTSPDIFPNGPGCPAGTTAHDESTPTSSGAPSPRNELPSVQPHPPARKSASADLTGSHAELESRRSVATLDTDVTDASSAQAVPADPPDNIDTDMPGEHELDAELVFAPPTDPPADDERAPRDSDCDADLDHDGAVGSADLFAFIGHFFAVDNLDSTDFNDSGAAEPEDLFMYLNVFFAGCENR